MSEKAPSTAHITEIETYRGPETREVSQITQAELDFPIGDTVTVQRTNGQLEHDWKVKMHAPDLAHGVLVHKFDKQTGNRIEKSVTYESLLEWQAAREEKLAKDLGITALDELVPQPEALETSVEVQIKNVEMQMDDIENALSVDEKKGVWDYANAVLPVEVNKSLNLLQPRTKAAGIHLKYAELYTQLRELRDKQK